MDKFLIMVDDFYEDPDAVRELALAVDYEKDKFTPNMSSVKALCPPALLTAFSGIVGRQLAASNSGYHGRFRISYEGAERKRDIHVDHPHWNGIIFLNTPEQCQGGTSLWRHKRTGLETFPSAEELAKYGFASQSDAMQKLIEEDGTDRNKWDEALRAPMKYNRLLLIRSTYFHSSYNDFGNTPETGRLVQTFFLDEV